MTITRLGQLTAETQDLNFQTDSIFPATISSTKAKTGTYSYRHAIGEEPAGIAVPATSRLRAGVWVNHAGVVVSSTVRACLFRLIRTSGERHTLCWGDDPSVVTIRLNSINTDLASISAGAIGLDAQNTWMHLGIDFYAHASAGYFVFYLNGVETLRYDGNTAGTISSIYFGGRAFLSIGEASGWSNYAYFDDFFVDDMTGEGEEAIPSKRFLFSLTNGAGANAQWTPSAGSNYQNVDDAGAPDDDTTYNKALSAGLKDTFNTADITVPADHVIRAKIPICIAKKTDAGTDSKLKLHTYDGATYQDSAEFTLTTAYATYFVRQPLQPDATAWNEVDSNAGQVGYESAGSF